MAERTIVRAPDGRALEVEQAGSGEAALVMHHGTPGAGSLLPEHVAAGSARGLRHVSYARPGYSRSDRHEGRSVADCARDVAVIADAIGIERFYTAGVSGGGPHAIACAALLPERVIAAASLAGVAPREAPGLDWPAGMGEENVVEFEAAEAGPDALLAWMQENVPGVAQAEAAGLAESLGDLVCAVDREVLTGAFAEFMVADLRLGIANGYWGWFDDDLAFSRPWGFELGAIERPVAIWQGAEDRFVPFAHGQWLARNVSRASTHLRPGEGHLSLAVTAYGEVLDELLAQA